MNTNGQRRVVLSEPCKEMTSKVLFRSWHATIVWTVISEQPASTRWFQVSLPDINKPDKGPTETPQITEELVANLEIYVPQLSIQRSVYWLLWFHASMWTFMQSMNIYVYWIRIHTFFYVSDTSAFSAWYQWGSTTLIRLGICFYNGGQNKTKLKIRLVAKFPLTDRHTLGHKYIFISWTNKDAAPTNILFHVTACVSTKRSRCYA